MPRDDNLTRTDPSRWKEPRMRRCGHCQKPYDEYAPRSLAETERLHSVLMITGPGINHDRPICDVCYEQVVGSAPRLNNNSSLDVGYSNHGPSNFLLKQLAEGRVKEEPKKEP